jgi:hypothetical protein
LKPGQPINIDEFKPLAKLVSGYELDPTKVYLIVLEGKSFDRGLADSLMRDIRQMHPDISIAVVATLHPKGIEVREKADEGKEEAGPAETVR